MCEFWGLLFIYHHKQNSWYSRRPKKDTQIFKRLLWRHYWGWFDRALKQRGCEVMENSASEVEWRNLKGLKKKCERYRYYSLDRPERVKWNGFQVKLFNILLKYFNSRKKLNWSNLWEFRRREANVKDHGIIYNTWTASDLTVFGSDNGFSVGRDTEDSFC